MARRSLTLPAAVALALGLIQGAGAVPAESPPPERLEAVTDVTAHPLEKGPALRLGTAAAPELYIVQLDQPAVPAYDGGLDGLAATGPAARGAERLDAGGAAAREYRDFLEEAQAELVASIGEEIGRSPQVRFAYTNALNGVAVELTADEARAVAELPGVIAVQVDQTHELQTDAGPEWIGAPALWDGSGTPDPDDAGTRGEGVIVGIIDSGINPANPSFADVVPVEDGGDGYDHTNPFGSGNYVGVCDPANTGIYVPDWGCNDKLIGAWGFTVGDPGSPIDDDGHGSHTASTAAGNQLRATTYSAPGTEHEFSATRTIGGVAPHANVIAYDVCIGGCQTAAIVAAIDQAIADGVHVVNYSIGSPAASPDPWSDPDSVGFFNARAAGIHVATSAGNDGPGAATVGSPADIPWITSVGATQHDRQWQAEVRELTADGGQTFPDIGGQGFSGPSDGAFPLVYAGDLGNPLCLAGQFPAGTDFTGQIVVCDRGQSGRVEKGQVVGALGAAGLVLANDAASGDSLNADAHAVPAVHIGYADGVALKEWMASVTGERASLSGGIEVISDDLGDIMASFSSRGPNRAAELISPSITAPGVDVLAANGQGNEVSWGFVSGTSMASPHVAGSFALLAAVQPDWTPAQAQSAVMTTAHQDVTDTDGTAADWFDMGSGRIDLRVAAAAGLVLDVDPADYVAADPDRGGDVKTLNIASMADSQCLQSCAWTRTVTGTASGAGTWTVSTESRTDGIAVTVEPSTFTIAEGQDVELTITADVAGASTDAYRFGTVVLTPQDGSAAPAAHLPVAALPSTGVLPDGIEIDTRRDAGSQESAPIEAIEIEEFTATVSGLVPAEDRQLSIPEDTTNTDPFDGNGTQTILLEVPGDGSRLVAALSESTAADMDLFVGTGSTPSAATLVCSSTTPASAEFCDVGDPEPGTWWVLVQNWRASAPGGTDTVTLSTAVVGGDAGNLSVEGPATQPAGEPFTLRVFYDEPAMEAGQTWYGAVGLGSGPDSPGDIGTLPISVTRHADDVTKTASTATAAPGDTVTYTLTVQPNVTPQDLTYTITDTLPAGTTYVPGSASGGASVEDGVLTWEGVLPTAVGVEGGYEITTSATDPSCVNPFTGTAEYLDLAEFGILANPAVSGDGVAYTGFAARSHGFYGTPYQGVGFTDDGFLIYDVPVHYGGAPGTPQTLPDPARPNNVAALLWQDMQIVYDQAANSGVSLATAGDLAIVEYDDLRLAGDPTGAQGTYDMEAFLTTGSNDLVFAYDNITGPLAGPITIGTENATGTDATTLVNAGSAAETITDGTIVCARYAGPDLDPVVITYDVTVDADVTDGQVLTNSAVHVTDDPGAQPVTVAVDVTAAVVSAVVTVEATRDAAEPATDGLFTFTRPADAAGGELTVAYTVRNGRYTRPGRDYEPLDGTVTFAPGETTATEVVGVIDRRGPSPRERTVTVTVEPGDGYQAGEPATATIEIVSDGR